MTNIVNLPALDYSLYFYFLANGMIDEMSIFGMKFAEYHDCINLFVEIEM